jgi:putative ABC transport system substrate-binding protein
VELSPINALDVHDMERGITAFAHSASGGLSVTSGGTGFHRNVIIRLAAQLRLPSVYPYRYYANEGGLAAYGPNTIEQYRRAARYLDRILKGEKPADLPVQAPTKYETGGQSQNRQGARHERAISAARPRRRGDRIRRFCCGA